MSNEEKVHILAEQGDLGLWDTPVTAEEQRVLNEQAKSENNKYGNDNKQN